MRITFKYQNILFANKRIDDFIYINGLKKYRENKRSSERSHRNKRSSERSQRSNEKSHRLEIKQNY